ncbi:MAG: hypothetical protein OXG11_09005 [Chloroflexi bacterium]|nr:hypothetical protein [Chloroflexota bacterium]
MTLQELLKDTQIGVTGLASEWAEVEINENDRDAAWELHVEMSTRIVTEPLPPEVGDEKAALTSIYSLFPATREILRRHGRQTVGFSRVAVPVLNHVVRPFTAKWHKESLDGAFEDQDRIRQFRQELKELQSHLRNYNRVLAEMAEVEELDCGNSERGQS